MKRLTTRLDDDLHKRLRFFSVETGESLQALVVRLLREELKRAEATKKRPRRR